MSRKSISTKKAAIIACSLSTIILFASIPLTHAATTPTKPAGDLTLSITGGWKVHLTVENPTDNAYQAAFTLHFYNRLHGWNGSATMIITPNATSEFAQRPLVLFGKISVQLSADDQTISKDGTIKFGYITFP
jgi:hypothetical protein